MGRLLVIFSGEACETRADYFEKIFVRMNKENAGLVQRIAWYICKACHKRTI